MREEIGPSELLHSGILPEHIFKSLRSELFEIVGGVKGFGERESGKSGGVKFRDSDQRVAPGQGKEKQGGERKDKSKENKEKQREKQ